MGGTVLEVRTEAGTVPVRVVRKRVKNLNLRVHPNGSVTLSIPWHTPTAYARDFLERRAAWIGRHVERVRERTRQAQAESAEIPALVPLWGELVPAPRPGGGAVAHGAKASADEREAFEDALECLYREEVRRALPDVAAQAEARVGVRAASWQVRRMRTRWGSCTPARRTIRISSALAAYPPTCLAFVVTHELVHLLEPSHNAHFHALLDRFYPENRDVARLLKRKARDVAAMAADDAVETG